MLRPRVLRKVLEELFEALSIIYQQSWLIQLPGDASVTPKGLEGESGELQDCQSDLQGEMHGADHLGATT